MVDEAHATGALGPGGRGSVAAAGLTERGRRRRRHARQGARLLRRLRLRRAPRWSSTCSTAPARSSSRPRLRRPRSPRPQAALELLEADPRRVERLRANAAVLRAALAAEGLAVGGSETQIVPVRVGDAEPTMELSERAARARRLRPGDPPADRPRGLLAPALHGDGHPPRRPSSGPPPAGRRGGARAGHRDATAAARLGPARRLAAPPWRASSSPAPAPRSARPWSPRRSPGPLAAAGRRVAVFKPAVTGLEDPGEPDHELLRRAAGSDAERRGDRPLPLRAARLPAPGGRARRRGDRPGPAARGGARPPRRGADVLVCEGVGGLLVPLAPGYLVRDLARRPRRCRWRSPPRRAWGRSTTRC